MIYGSIEELVGKTPILRLSRLEGELSLKAKIYAKLEFFNPAGSVKDRVALAMIEAARREGILREGGSIIEATSGNTGIALAMIAAVRGYRAVILMPENMSRERMLLIEALGGEVILTDRREGMAGAVRRAEELARETDGSFMPRQFENTENPKAHRLTTAEEILSDIENTDIFISGVGTGGTLSGVGQRLKEKNSKTEIVAVEPKESAVLSGGSPSPHGIAGIGAGFVPRTLDRSVIDRIITVSFSEAAESARLIARTEGVLCGISSGAAIYAAITEAEREENEGKSIVTVLPDGIERYLSTDLFKNSP